MSCMCLVRLKDFAASLQNLPLNLLASLIPHDLLQLPMLGATASGFGTVQAMASASAQLSAALRLGLPPFPFPALNLGKLEAMAFVAGTSGVNSFNANASLQLSRMATSINVNLPSIMQMAMELLAPLAEPLMDLLAMLQSVEAVQRTFHVNLAMPGAMPRLQAALTARASASLNLAASVDAMANLGSYGRLLNAAAALGFNLALPGESARFSAALNVAAGLPIPPLKIDLPQMNTLANLLAALAPIRKSVLGVNMTLPNAFQLLAAALQTLLANLMEPLNLSAVASVSETARLGSQLSAVPAALSLAVQLRALAALKLNWPLNLLPDLAPLAAAARFGDATGISVWSTSPCSGSCPVGTLGRR